MINKNKRMENAGGSITSMENGTTVENFLFTYSEEEKLENSLNKLNAGLVLNPKFIPVYTHTLKELSLLEATIYGFIDYFLGNNEKFYCTNEQLAEMLNMGTTSISNAIKSLKQKGLIDITYKIRTGGGKIRFIRLTKSESPTYKICKSDLQNVVYIENKKIENKKINNIVPFETFRTEFPHARKGKKAESKKHYEQLDSNEVMQQVRILVWKIRAGLQDGQYIPACERWIRDFTPLNEDVIKQDLVKICKRHLNAGGDMKQRSLELKQTFGEEEINKIVKAIQQKDSPKNLFIKQS